MRRWPWLFLLSIDPKQILDELRLAHRIISVDPFHLTFPHHVHRLYTFQRSLSSVKRAEALTGSPPPSDESYIPRQIAAGSPIEKYGSPEGTAFPLVKGGVNTQTAKSACSALAMPPLFDGPAR